MREHGAAVALGRAPGAGEQPRRPPDGLRADQRAKRDRRRVPASYGAEEGAGPARHSLEPRNSENTSWGNVSTASAFRNTCTWGQNRGARPGGECG